MVGIGKLINFSKVITLSKATVVKLAYIWSFPKKSICHVGNSSFRKNKIMFQLRLSSPPSIESDKWDTFNFHLLPMPIRRARAAKPISHANRRLSNACVNISHSIQTPFTDTIYNTISILTHLTPSSKYLQRWSWKRFAKNLRMSPGESDDQGCRKRSAQTRRHPPIKSEGGNDERWRGVGAPVERWRCDGNR